MKEECSKESIKLEIPTEKYLQFDHPERKIPMPFIIYADFELLLIKTKDIYEDVVGGYVEDNVTTILTKN